MNLTKKIKRIKSLETYVASNCSGPCSCTVPSCPCANTPAQQEAMTITYHNGLTRLRANLQYMK